MDKGELRKMIREELEALNEDKYDLKEVHQAIREIEELQMTLAHSFGEGDPDNPGNYGNLSPGTKKILEDRFDKIFLALATIEKIVKKYG